MTTEIKFKKLDPRAKIPTRGSKNAGALDLYVLEDTVIKPGECVKVRTGIAWEPPEYVVGLVHPRSSSFGAGLSIDAVIDSDYRGEWNVQVRNVNQSVAFLIPTVDFLYGQNPGVKLFTKLQDLRQTERNNTLTLLAGSRFAQFVVQCHGLDGYRVTEVETLNETARGVGGFGSTGT